jgi:beta-phosphoglucomutase family hydrolase
MTLGLPDGVRACLFDLDGVLTDTASVHRRAWKTMFDEYLRTRAHGDQWRPFDDADYRTYVDGRTRDDGVRGFLDSRGVSLPDGNADDKPDADTVNGLANRKNELFQEHLHSDGVSVFDGSRRYLQAVSMAGLGIAVVSSSANTAEVLEISGLAQYVQQRVDGLTIRAEHLKGKPAPDSYLRGAELLGVPAGAAAIFEDAVSGVQAGLAGNFGIVIGVDRNDDPEVLQDNGADLVVADLAELLGR